MAVITCFFTLLQMTVFAQTGSIKGLLRGPKNEPVDGATIYLSNVEKKYNQSGNSDKNGLFQFTQVPEGSGYTIEISHIGYTTQTFTGYAIKKNEQLSLDLKLQDKDDKLSDVVVVGYGSRSRSEITGAVSTLKREDLNMGVYSSPVQLLQGRVPGLVVTRSGNPNENPAVIMRGPSSFRQGNQAYEPFYVIDGVPGASINTVAPDDIESIDILKDASSTAIYGSRAANGVIIITTRKVRKGRSQLSYNGYVAIEEISNTLKMADANALRKYVSDNKQTFDAVNNDSVSNTNWQKEVTRTGVSHNQNVSFNGGNNHSSYAVSLNYLNNEGIIKTSSMNRLVIRSNVEHRAFNDRLKLNVNFVNSSTNGKLIPDQVFNNMMTYLPTVSIKQKDGSYTEDKSRTVGTGGYYNPVGLLNQNKIENKINLMLVNGVVNVNVLPGLDLTASLSLQKQQADTNLYYYKSSMLARAVNADGYAQRNAVKSTKKVLEAFGNYNVAFGLHNIKLLAGYSWQEDREGDGFQVSGSDFISDDLLWNNIGFGNNSITTRYGNIYVSTVRLISFYGRLGYDYDGKYMFQASLRRDGSSAFGNNQRWGYFPSASVGWNIHKEDFMQNLPVISALKLRAAYGVSGNSTGFNAYTTKTIYANGSSYFYYMGNWINAIVATQNPNSNLKWERTSTFNAGFDFALLNNRVSGSFDYYIKKTSDLIGDYSVSTQVYPTSVLTANVGEMENKGIEVQVNATPVKTDKFTWKTSFNVAHNKNRIVSLTNDVLQASSYYTANFVGGRGQSAVSGYQIIAPNLPLGSFNTLRYAGKGTDGKSMFYGADGKASADSTAFTSFAITGSAQPTVTYGWSNSFRYGKFDLNVFLRGVKGNKILNATRADMNAPIYANLTNVLESTTTEENIKDGQAHFISDRYIEDGSFIRLDNATLGYTFNPMNKFTLRLYVSGNNLFIITKYKGVDPEVNMSGQTPGIDYRNFYPKTRSYLMGLNLTF
jgi:TonB-dependent starch-binding outer membrane protein SusC